MKRLLTVLVMLLVMATTAFASRTATCTINNFQRSGSTYSFDVLAKSTGTSSINVGDSKFFFTYNSSALQTPVLTNINSQYSGGHYAPMSVSIVNGFLKVFVDYTGGSSTRLISTDVLLCTVNMTITDPSGRAGLVWFEPWSGIRDVSGNNVTNAFVGSDDGILPIQLSSFTGAYSVSSNSVQLDWTTLSEINNYGFEVQRRCVGSNEYADLGLVAGHGTTGVPQSYTFTDNTVQVNIQYQYRLRQIDLDGTTHDTDPITISTVLTSVTPNAIPMEFRLAQNYPNPFNPSTNLSFYLDASGYTSLVIYDVLGQEVDRLVDGNMSIGSHTITWNAANQSSGMYIGVLSSGVKQASVKLLLSK